MIVKIKRTALKKIKMSQLLLKKRDAIVRNHFVKKNIVNVLIEESIALMNAIALIVKIDRRLKIIIATQIKVIISQSYKAWM